MKVLLASHNKKKIIELQDLLSSISPEIEVISMSDIGYNDEIVEDGNTFEENSLIKLQKAVKQLSCGCSMKSANVSKSEM